MFSRKKQSSEQDQTVQQQAEPQDISATGSSNQPPQQDTTGASARSAQTGAAARQQQVEIDDSDLTKCYANFCRVMGTPEEVILDVGLSSQPMGTPAQSVKVNQRVVMNYFTAKRMIAALHMTVRRHEETFGPLEMNIQKRANPSSPAP